MHCKNCKNASVSVLSNGCDDSSRAVISVMPLWRVWNVTVCDFGAVNEIGI